MLSEWLRAFNYHQPSLIVVTRAAWSFNAAWRAVLGKRARSPQSRRHTSALGRVAGGPRRGSVPQAPNGPRHRSKGYFATVQIYPLIFTLFRCTSAVQGRRRPALIFCTAGAGGIKTVETCAV